MHLTKGHDGGDCEMNTNKGKAGRQSTLCFEENITKRQRISYKSDYAAVYNTVWHTSAKYNVLGQPSVYAEAGRVDIKIRQNKCHKTARKERETQTVFCFSGGTPAVGTA